MTTWYPERSREDTATWLRLLGPPDPLNYRIREEVFRERRAARDVFMLAQGIVLLYCELPGGGERIVGLRFPGEVLEHCSYVLGTSYPVSARTLVPSIIYRASLADVREKERLNPEICDFFKRLMCIDIHNAALFIIKLKTSSIADRLEQVLLLLASVLGRPPQGGTFTVPVLLRDEQLADLLGCSTRQLKRVKKQMVAQRRLRIDGRGSLLLSVIEQ